MWLALTLITVKSETLDSLRAALSHLPVLVRFTVAMAAILITPSLSRRLKLPSVVGVLFAGIILGPHVLTYSETNSRWRTSCLSWKSFGEDTVNVPSL